MKYTNVIITIKTLNICFRLFCVIQVNIVTIMLLKVSKSPPWCSPERHISKGKSQKRQKIPETSFQPFLLVL